MSVFFLIKVARSMLMLFCVKCWCILVENESCMCSFVVGFSSGCFWLLSSGMGLFSSSTVVVVSVLGFVPIIVFMSCSASLSGMRYHFQKVSISPVGNLTWMG